jgi:tRNA pseudouridine55 synthase
VLSGVLVLDKPGAMSSAGAVDRVRKKLGVDRAGHGGTLDPLATGVLPICLGYATRLARFVLAEDKSYLASGLLGIETDSLDRTGAITREAPVAVTREAMLAAIAGRLGEQDQVPPMYSAIKIEGKRSYKRARRGEIIAMPPRRIRIDRLELVAFDPPSFTIAVDCTKGTYIRSLLADLGTDVGCGAHLTDLRRTRAGPFTIEQAVTLDDLDLGKLVPLEDICDLPKVTVTDALVLRIRNGVQMPVGTFGQLPEGEVQIVDADGKLVAVAHALGTIVAYDLVIPAR